MNVDKLYISHAQVNRAPPLADAGHTVPMVALENMLVNQHTLSWSFPRGLRELRRKMTLMEKVPVEERLPRRRQRKSDSSKLVVAPHKCRQSHLAKSSNYS